MLHVDDGPAQAAVATLLENEGVKRAIGFASSTQHFFMAHLVFF